MAQQGANRLAYFRVQAMLEGYGFISWQGFHELLGFTIQINEEFLELMCLYEAIHIAARRLGGYAHLWFSEDTQSQEALGFLGQMEQLSTDVQNRLLFFSLWWKELDDEPAQRLIAASGDCAYYLESLRHFKPYTLSEPEEKIINLKDVNGPNALVKLYDIITNRFTFELEIEGETKEMTRAELSACFRAPSPEIRAAWCWL